MKLLFKNNYYGITLLILSCEFLLISIALGFFNNVRVLLGIVIILCNIVFSFLFTCLAIPIYNRYGDKISGLPLVHGFVLWPLTLIRLPKIIAKAENDRKVKIIHDIMES